MAFIHPVFEDSTIYEKKMVTSKDPLLTSHEEFCT